jgi:hypothetical protein
MDFTVGDAAHVRHYERHNMRFGCSGDPQGPGQGSHNQRNPNPQPPDP